MKKYFNGFSAVALLILIGTSGCRISNSGKSKTSQSGGLKLESTVDPLDSRYGGCSVSYDDTKRVQVVDSFSAGSDASTDYWFSGTELRKLANIYRSKGGDLVFGLALRCQAAPGDSAVVEFSLNQPRDKAIFPFEPKDYLVKSLKNPKAPISAHVTFGENRWEMVSGVLKISGFDRSSIAGSFVLSLDETGVEKSRQLSLKISGKFVMRCKSGSKCVRS